MFDYTHFMIRSMCSTDGMWPNWLIMLHKLSDGLICLSYVCMSAFLAACIRMWPRMNLMVVGDYYKVLLAEFATFIVLCGLTHANSVLAFYKPMYIYFGAVSAVTAVVSFVTAVTLCWVLGKSILPKEKK